MPELPGRPDLDQLRRQARELLRVAAHGDPTAIARLRAVSGRVTLSAAQLAVAREYGYRSWPALKAEVERRRLPEPAAIPPLPRGDERGSLGTLEERWSFGGATAIAASAGVLLPEVLVVGPRHATVYASLTPSGNGQPAGGRLGRLLVPGMPLARWAWSGQSRRARRRHVDAAMTTVRALARPGELTVIDDQGVRYTLSPGGMFGIIGSSGEPAGPMSVRLGLDPVPGRGIRWLELRSQDGSAIRLLPSARPAVQVSQLMPTSASPAERELLARTAELQQSGEQADGPRHHLDIGAGLPPIDGVSMQVDSLISRPDSWRLYLRATPGWWRHSKDGSRRWAPATVHAEDDRGGTYLSTPDGGRWHPNREEPGHEEEEPGHEELALRFLPRLDPQARALTLTFRGANEKVLVDLRLESAAMSLSE
jgi:hypothetical protein